MKPGPKAEPDHALILEIRKRFTADVIRREPVDRNAWLAKLRHETKGPGDADPV